MPYLLSTRGYGILWDNASITRVGDPEPYRPLDTGMVFWENQTTHEHGFEGRWTAEYSVAGKPAGSRQEFAIEYPYLRNRTHFPPNAPIDQVTQVVWSGSYTAETSGSHKFRLYSSSYVKVFADGREVLERWRQNWNPWYHDFDLMLTRGKPVELRVEWQPNQGYIALYHADPLPPADRHSVSFASEAGKSIDYYVIPGKDMAVDQHAVAALSAEQLIERLSADLAFDVP